MAYFYKPPLDGTPARFIARHFALIILTENDEGYARRLRQDGYRGRILRYVDGGEVEGPGPYWRRPRHCERAYQPYQYSLADRARIFCQDINPHESWFLHDGEGRRILSRFRSAGGIWRTNYAMNPEAAGWRRFAARRLRAERRLGYDGIFLDNIALSGAGWRADAAGRGIQEFANGAAWRRAMAGFLAAVRRALGPVPIWANLTHDPNTPGDWESYLPALNGVMVEDFLFGWRSYALTARGRQGQWENIRGALASGRSVLLVAQGGRGQRARLQTALAGYWLLRPPQGRLSRPILDASVGSTPWRAAPAPTRAAARWGPRFARWGPRGRCGRASTGSPACSGACWGGPAGNGRPLALRASPSCRGARLFFRYGDAGDRAYRTVWWYRLYSHSPGRPMGPARRTRGGWERRFAGGTVRLDLKTLRGRMPGGAAQPPYSGRSRWPHPSARRSRPNARCCALGTPVRALGTSRSLQPGFDGVPSAQRRMLGRDGRQRTPAGAPGVSRLPRGDATRGDER